MIDDNKHIYKNYKIYLVVPNKKKVLGSYKRDVVYVKKSSRKSSKKSKTYKE